MLVANDVQLAGNRWVNRGHKAMQASMQFRDRLASESLVVTAQAPSSAELETCLASKVSLPENDRVRFRSFPTWMLTVMKPTWIKGKS